MNVAYLFTSAVVFALGSLIWSRKNNQDLCVKILLTAMSGWGFWMAALAAGYVVHHP